MGEKSVVLRLNHRFCFLRSSCVHYSSELTARGAKVGPWIAFRAIPSGVRCNPGDFSLSRALRIRPPSPECCSQHSLGHVFRSCTKLHSMADTAYPNTTVTWHANDLPRNSGSYSTIRGITPRYPKVHDILISDL